MKNSSTPDFVEIKPRQGIDIVVRAPGSKSYTQRALIIAAMASGKSVLLNPLISQDTGLLINALQELGAIIKLEKGNLVVVGTRGMFTNPHRQISLGNNGTALRLLISALSLGTGEYIVTGDERLCERPVQPLLTALNEIGGKAISIRKNGCPPVSVQGGRLHGGRAVLRNIESSQYISSLLIACPYAESDTIINVEGPLVSTPYVNLTLSTMKHFGVAARSKDGSFFVEGGQVYSGREYQIEGDISSASYFFLAAALSGGRVRVENITGSSSQGDIGFLDILARLGCGVERKGSALQVSGRSLAAGDFNFDLGDMPDMVPGLAVLSALRQGQTIISNIGHLRFKESNRIQALVAELQRVGINATAGDDQILIYGGRPHGAEIETYNDHRIAMSFAMLGLAVPGIKIKDPSCVGKSFPNFWEQMGLLGEENQ